MSSKQEVPKELPEIIVDTGKGRKYRRGKFLGKGGFARCYEMMDLTTKVVSACKIVPKTLLVKPHQKEKMVMEIKIHGTLHHQHIVEFRSHFEDDDNVYIILELCKRRSLMELHKRRKAVTEPEARYFLKQLLLGVAYLHKHQIIHRDLKLGNLFINDNMELKIGDFGLATLYEGRLRKTLCGTPNYIAPEILGKNGHGYEVDVWSIGCILYTLLVGKPPFETQSLKDTYSRIKNNVYMIPSKVGPLAKVLIEKLLQHNPAKRPTIGQILEDDFMTKGYIPRRLPTSCLTTAPRFDAHPNSSIIALRKPLGEINSKDASPLKLVSKVPPSVKDTNKPAERKEPNEITADQMQDINLRDLYKQVSELTQAEPERKVPRNEDEAEDPSAAPMIWVSKWVDYSDKYGLGYQLSDDSIGVFFNDYSKIVLLADGENFHYIERNGKEHYHCLKKQPQELYKKATLLCYFQSYMNEHLLKAGAANVPRDGDELARIPSLRTYFRTRSAIILLLSNGTFQINFFDDHVKLILCPLMGAVTYIDARRNFRTFRFSLLAEYGCSDDLAVRLRYAKSMIQRLLLTHQSGMTSSSQSAKSTVSNATDRENRYKRAA